MAKKYKKQFTDTRFKILQATSELFTQKGIAVTSFSDISKASDLSKGTITYYFPTKEFLVYEVHEDVLKRITDVLFKWIECLCPGHDYKVSIKALFDLLLENRALLKLHFEMLSEGFLSNAELEKRYKQRYLEWQTMIKIGFMKIGKDADASMRACELTLALIDNMILRTSLGMDILSLDYLPDNI